MSEISLNMRSIWSRNRKQKYRRGNFEGEIMIFVSGAAIIFPTPFPTKG